MPAPTYPTAGSTPWDATLKTYIDGTFSTPAVSLGYSNGSNDTTAINTILAANTGKVVRGVPGENYLITTLTLQANQTLDMTGCNITQIATTNTTAVESASQSTARTIMDGVTTAASTTFTSATAAFTSGDVGKTLWVYNAGVSGAIHKTTVASFTNSTTVVMAAAAVATTSGSSASIGPRTAGIRVIGGTWNKGTNNGHMFRLRRVDRPILRDLRVTGSGIGGMKYAINFGDATDLTVDTISFDYTSDGVHLNGPIFGGSIHNISGYTRDDMVSLTPNDWSPNNDVWGDIVDVVVDDVGLNIGDNCAVKVLGGSSSPLTRARSIRVSNVTGSTTKLAQSFGGLVCIGDDTGSANTIGGLVDDVTVQNVDGLVPSSSYQVQINGTNIGTIVLDGLYYDNAASTTAPVGIGGATTGTMDHVILRNLRIRNTTHLGGAVVASGNTTINRLTVDTVTVRTWNSSTSTSTLIAMGAGSGGVKAADISNVKVLASTGGVIVNNSTTAMNYLSVDNVECNNSANSMFVVNATGAVIGDCTISRVVSGLSGWTAGYIAQATNSGGGFTRLVLDNCHTSGVGGAPVLATNSANVLGTLILSNVSSVGASWGIGDLATTTDIYLSDVVATSSANNTLNARATASLTIRGEGSNRLSASPQITAGAVLTSLTSDLAYIATAGAVPTVTAGVAAGTSPTVSIVGNDRSGTITVNVGTSPATGNLVTLAMTRTMAAAVRNVQITPTNAAASGARPYIATKSTTGFIIGAQTAPTASTAHTFDYQITV